MTPYEHRLLTSVLDAWRADNGPRILEQAVDHTSKFLGRVRACYRIMHRNAPKTLKITKDASAVLAVLRDMNADLLSTRHAQGQAQGMDAVSQGIARIHVLLEALIKEYVDLAKHTSDMDADLYAKKVSYQIEDFEHIAQNLTRLQRLEALLTAVLVKGVEEEDGDEVRPAHGNTK